VWQNLHESRAPEEVRSTWYAVIHDILPTRKRLAAINLTYTTTCRQCNANDSLSHRLKECGEGPSIWTWTKSKIAMMLRVDPKHVPISWALHPDYNISPSTPETTSCILDSRPHGLVLDEWTTTHNHDRIHRIHAAIQMERLHTSKTSNPTGKLFERTLKWPTPCPEHFQS